MMLCSKKVQTRKSACSKDKDEQIFYLLVVFISFDGDSREQTALPNFCGYRDSDAVM